MIDVSGLETVAKIDAVTVREGFATPVEEVASGGGILSHEANLTLERDTITDNRADGDGAPGKPGAQAYGGGLDASGGELTLREDVISDDTAEANGGVEMAGGLAIGGGVEDGALSTITRTSFISDTALSRGGDAPSNTAQVGGVADGGGMRLVQSGERDSVSEVTFSGDNADASDGPGGSAAPNPYSGPLAQGGGLFLRERSESITLSSLTASGNVARAAGDGEGGLAGDAIGGGVIVEEEAEASSFVNATITGNAAMAPGQEGVAEGGGVYAYGRYGVVSLLSSTLDADSVEGSAAQSGGGDLGVRGAVAVRDTIVADGAGPAASSNCQGAPESLGNNLDSSKQCGFQGSGDITGVDPLLAPLHANGGGVETQALLTGSPAIDAGPPAGCPAADARGVTRPQGVACDIGAFELALPQLANASASAITTTGATLRVTAANGDVLPGSVRFEYGTSTSYGTVTAATALGSPVSGASIAAAVGGLKPDTIYHFRAVAANPDGSAAGADQTFTTATPPPVISGLRISPGTFRAAGGSGSSVGRSRRGTGATINYSDSLAATSTITVQLLTRGYVIGRSCQAHRPRHPSGRVRACTRYVTRGSFHNLDRGGHVMLHFTGRVGGRALKPGSYRLSVVARGAGGTSTAATSASFRVRA